MTVPAVLQCPLCELRFRYGIELAHHIASDHPSGSLDDITPAPTWDGVITVPFDPARPGTAAMRVAVSLAAAAGFAVEAVAAPAPGVPVTERYLAARQRDLRQSNVPTVAPCELAGDPAGAIVDHAAEGRTSLLCMATRARSHLADRLLGGVTAAVLRHSPVPVVLVGPGVVHPGTPIRRVVVGLDGSSLAQRAAEAAAALADLVGVGVELVGVEGPRADAADHATEAVLRRTAESLSPPARSYEVVVDDDPARALADHTGLAGDSLLVVGTHGRTGLDRLVLGSVAHDLVRRARCPVMVVPRTADLRLDRPGTKGPTTADAAGSR